MPEEKPMLSVIDVAHQLRVNAETVRRWLNAGTLRGVKLGARRLWRIQPEELRRFIAPNDRPVF